jgi:hypothetical protein
MCNNCVFMFRNVRFDNSWFRWWQVSVFIQRSNSCKSRSLFVRSGVSPVSGKKKKTSETRIYSIPVGWNVWLLPRWGNWVKAGIAGAYRDWERKATDGEEDHRVWCHTGVHVKGGKMQRRFESCWTKLLIARKVGLFSRYGGLGHSVDLRETVVRLPVNEINLSPPQILWTASGCRLLRAI